MRLRYLFLIFLLLQLPVYAGLIYLAYGRELWLMYAAEALLVADIIFSVAMYRKIMLPLRNLEGALNMLKSRDWNVAMRKVGQPDVDAIVDVFNRMMQELHAQRVNLEETRHFLTYLSELAPVGIIIRGQRGRNMLTNPAATRMLGACTAIEPTLETMDDGADMTLRAESGLVYRCSRRHFIENGMRRDFFIIENVTDSVAAAEREAYGKLIRLIAHEVNNTVTGLATALDNIQTTDELDRQLLDASRDRAYNLSEFIGRFAEVVKTPAPVRRRLDLCSLLRNLAPFLESLCMPRGIAITAELPEGPVYISADAALLEQVIVNIVKNSAESIGADGNISISLSEKPATLIIADNGPGISPDKADKLFTPFFTDKPTGQGIGLTFVADVLRRHNALFSLGTAPDGITRFTIKF